MHACSPALALGEQAFRDRPNCCDPLGDDPLLMRSSQAAQGIVISLSLYMSRLSLPLSLSLSPRNNSGPKKGLIFISLASLTNALKRRSSLDSSAEGGRIYDRSRVWGGSMDLACGWHSCRALSGGDELRLPLIK